MPLVTFTYDRHISDRQAGAFADNMQEAVAATLGCDPGIVAVYGDRPRIARGGVPLDTIVRYGRAMLDTLQGEDLAELTQSMTAEEILAARREHVNRKIVQGGELAIVASGIILPEGIPHPGMTVMPVDWDFSELNAPTHPGPFHQLYE